MFVALVRVAYIVLAAGALNVPTKFELRLEPVILLILATPLLLIVPLIDELWILVTELPATAPVLVMVRLTELTFPEESTARPT